VYAWGRGEHGRLGFGDDKSSRMVPLKVELLAGENIVQVIDLGITGMLLASAALAFPVDCGPEVVEQFSSPSCAAELILHVCRCHVEEHIQLR